MFAIKRKTYANGRNERKKKSTIAVECNYLQMARHCSEEMMKFILAKLGANDTALCWLNFHDSG